MKALCRAAGVMLLCLGVASSAYAATSPPKQIVQALNRIPAAAGGSVWERLKACHITFAKGSWM